MKKIIILALGLIAFSANAEVVITGGFGTDGATGEGLPFARSVKDAEAVFNALNTGADGRGTKTIALADESFFECKRPYRGVARLNAGCQITLRASQNGKLIAQGGRSRTVIFTGKLATKIYLALPGTGNARVGASTKSVANLSCVKVVRPGVEATCTIRDTFAISMDI